MHRLHSMHRLSLVLLLITPLVHCGSTAQAAEPLWKQLVPQKHISADASADYTLTEDQGPWLVLAASFSGPEGENQARDLVLELRSEFHLPSYYYGMTFELDGANPGRGIDGYGAPIKRRYKRGERVIEHAVLVGEFPAIDDPEAQRLLKKIKHLQPASLATEDGKETTQSLATVRQFHDFVQKKLGKNEDKGPMGHAFMTRNPLLPREYFAPQGVDEDVAKWNQGLDHSLMKCAGKYSIRVATFRGRSTLQGASDKSQQARTRKAKEDEPLVVAAHNAHLLAVALREKGWDAYEFHDRHESYVAVGSFDDGKTLPDGRVILDSRDARIIFNTFGATSPNNVFNRPALEDQRREQLQKQRFETLFTNSHGKVAEGFHPKRFVGLPFDIYPQPVLVPRRSISAAYARN